MGETAINIERLSSEERLELLERIWDSLAPADVPVTEAQRQELDRRLDALDADVRDGRAVGVPWEQVLQELRNRR